MKRYLIGLAVVSLSFSSVSGDVFLKGKSNVGVSVGAASSYGETYTLVGITGNYFVIDNLSVSGYYRGWFGATPTQHELSLGTNYYMPLTRKFRPYGGVFFREHFVSGAGYDDFFAYGVRGGVSMVNTNNTYLSVGYAYEVYGDCQFSECSNSYPELIAGFSF